MRLMGQVTFGVMLIARTHPESCVKFSGRTVANFESTLILTPAPGRFLMLRFLLKSRDSILNVYAVPTGTTIPRAGIFISTI